MTESLKIAVADDEPKTLAYFQETLTELGHEVICAVGNGADLVKQCRDSHPDMIITDIKMPDMDGIQAASEITRDKPAPVILVSAYHDSELIERAQKDHVLAYLIKPVKQANLETAIALAMRRFKEFQALQQQAKDLRQALEDRKIIERAKGIIMKRSGLDEQDAFRRLQLLSSKKNQKMVELARLLVTAEEVLELPE